MKATINKSNLMKRAWAIYREENTRRQYDFRFALIRAWKEAKREVESKNRVTKVHATVDTWGMAMNNVICNAYNTARPGAYFGD